MQSKTEMFYPGDEEILNQAKKLQPYVKIPDGCLETQQNRVKVQNCLNLMSAGCV